MITHNHRPWVRICLTLIAPVLLGAATLLVAQSPTASEPTPPQENQPQGGGRQGRGGFNQDNSAADFSPKPPIQASTPAEEAKGFILPAGYRLELVPRIPRSSTRP